MAKLILENGFLSDEPEKSEYDRWVAGTIEKEVPINMLYEHPQNYDLVGHIDNNTRAELLEDIRQNGIREPLQVWYNAGKLFVVSGNERLSIAKELKYKTVKCVKVEFKDNDEVLRFIYAVNKHRKQVKTGAADLLLALFPPEKYPLLYADLRSHVTAGNMRTEETEKEREVERDEQRKLDIEVKQITGWTDTTVKKTKSQARKKAALNRTKEKPKREILKYSDNQIFEKFKNAFYSHCKYYLRVNYKPEITLTKGKTSITAKSIKINENDMKNPDDCYIMVFTEYLLVLYKYTNMREIKNKINDTLFTMFYDAGFRCKEIKPTK